MLESLTLDDAEGNAVPLYVDGTRELVRVTGLIGIGGVRDSRRVLPQGHGGIDDTKWQDGKLVVIQGEVAGATVQAAEAQMRALEGPMLDTLDVGPALLKWTSVGGVPLQREVRFADMEDPPYEEAAAILRYQAQFYAEDPRAYAQTPSLAVGATLTTATGGARFKLQWPMKFTSSGGGVTTVVNSGSRATPLTIRIHGACVNPQFVLNGKRIVIDGTITAGDYLELDTRRKTALLNGQTSRQNMVNSSMTEWMEAPRGTSIGQTLAADFDSSARTDTELRSAY